MIYIGLKTYSQETIEKIITLDIDGVVIGDILCNKKMFEYGGNEIPDFLYKLKENGKKVIFQTPMYATDRVFDELISKVTYYYNNGLISAILVQDIGVANACHKRCENLTLIWGKMGYARNPINNIETLKFYQSLGIRSVECKDLRTCDAAKNVGFEPYLLIGFPTYLTINRECYYKFEHNIFDGDCDRGCLQKDKLIIPAKEQMEATIDGYVLGYKNNYLEESIINAKKYENAIIYADSVDEIMNFLEKI